jgi:hypothetical protein
MSRVISMRGDEKNAYRTFVGKLEGNRPLGKPRHRQVDSIKLDLREMECGGMVWIDLAQGRDKWKVMAMNV